MQSNLEATFLFQLKALGITGFVQEHQFLKNRRFRFDFAWVVPKIAIEIEGGTWAGGRHTTGSGFQKDCEKYNLAVLEGWKVFRFDSKQVKSGEAILFAEKVFKAFDIIGRKG